MDTPDIAEEGARAADRLSALPNSILHTILACLSTMEAARTSVLSRQWRHLWCAVMPSLCIDIDQRESRASAEIAVLRQKVEMRETIHRKKDEDWDRFRDLADGLTLPLRDASSPPLERFRLGVVCDRYRHVARTWIRRGLQRRPAEFHLCCYNDEPNVRSTKTWPPFPTVILSRSPEPGAYTCRLRTLHLSGLELCADFADKIIAAESPVLEDVHLEDCEYEFRRLASSSLKNLSMDRCRREFSVKSLVLALPRLTSLRIVNGDPAPVTMECEMPSLASACLTGYTGNLGILRALRDVTSLNLTGFSGKEMLIDDETTPVFRNLRTLLLDACELGPECRALRRFLRDAPDLETLTVRNCNLPTGSRREEVERMVDSADDEEVEEWLASKDYYPCHNLNWVELEFKDGYDAFELVYAVTDIIKEVDEPVEVSVQDGIRRVKFWYK